MNIKEVIKELSFFSDEIIEFNGPADSESVADFMQKFNVHLPQDYLEMLKIFNGLSLMGSYFLGIYPEDGKFDLIKCYNIEHFEVANPMPLYLVPFSPDGRGNHYCFDTRYCNYISCPIVFWQYDYIYAGDDQPEVANSSFAEWVKEVIIDWTLEDYDYTGSER